MILAIVGSTELHPSNPAVVKIITEALDRYKPSTVVSGGAPGVDTAAAELARARGIEVIEHIPVVWRWKDGFKPRNERIARDCDALIRIASKDSSTYGSGWTRDFAANLGKPTEEFLV